MPDQSLPSPSLPPAIPLAILAGKALSGRAGLVERQVVGPAGTAEVRLPLQLDVQPGIASQKGAEALSRPYRRYQEDWVVQFEWPLIAGRRFPIYLPSMHCYVEESLLDRRMDILGSGRPARIRTIDRPIALCGRHNQDNFFHWHTNVLPSIASTTEASNERFSVALLPTTRWQVDSLKLAGFDHLAFEQVSEAEVVTAPRAAMYSGWNRHALVSSPRLLNYVPQLLHRLRKDPVPSTLGLPERIFVSRLDSRRRVCTNELRLCLLMEELGYFIFIPSKYSYREQVAIASQARVIVGLHGAGLTNMIFAPSSSHIVEIAAGDFLNLGYFSLAQHTGQAYSLFGHSESWSPVASPGDQPSEFAVDLPRLTRFLRAL